MFQENTVSQSLIGAMRGSSWTMRSIASVVILTFGSLVTAPAVAAVKQEIKEIQWHKADATNAGKLPAKLEETHQVLTRLASRNLKDVDIKASHAQVHALKADLEALDKGAMDDFAANEAHIKAHKLPEIIEQRQQEAVKTYRTRMDTLMAELNAADSAKDAVGFMAHVGKAKAHLDKVQVMPFHEKLDPRNLPSSVAKSTGVKPRLTKKDYQARPVAPPKRAQVAAIGPLAGILSAADVTGALPTNPSDPSYIAATDDVQITPAIQAQAAALHNDPVQIYNWVHNNVEYIPTYGSIQGSDMTLQTLKGNDFDQASLLIALLRASNVPARYVYGTIQAPIAQVENWVGGATDANAALNLMSQGGIPVTGLVQGGQIKYGQLEHVWVEAWVNFVPSRAAKSGAGNTWVPMDASFKQYTYTQGMNLDQGVTFDNAAFMKQVIDTGTTDGTGNWIQGESQSFAQDTVTTYQTNLKNFVAATKPAATVGDVFGIKSINANSSSSLSSSLAYTVTAVGSRMTALPQSMQAQVTLDFYADADSGSPVFSRTFSLPQIVGKRITLGYMPSTASDTAVIQDAMANYQKSFPAYLVSETPSIFIEQQAIWTGSSVTAGAAQNLSVTISYGSINDSRQYDFTAGDLGVLGIDASGIPYSAWNGRIQAHDLTSYTGSDYTQETLYQAMQSYWAELDMFGQIASKTDRVLANRLPSFGMAIAPLTVSYNFGVPVSASYESRVLDVKENRVTAESVGGSHAATVGYVEKIGLLSSYLESGICDQIFALQPGYSASAVTMLGYANAAGQRIYRISAANIGTVLNSLTIPDDVKTDIQNAVGAGMQAIVPERELSVGGYTGIGYVLTDATTGSGAYRISGGRDGNNSPAPGNVLPLPQLPAVPMIGLFLKAGLPNADATITIDSAGMIKSISVAADAAPAEEALGAAILTPEVIIAAALVLLVVIAVAAVVFEEEYPPTSIILRKYVSDAALPPVIALTGVIYATDKTGDFGQGVYFVDPDEGVNASIGCPVTAAQQELVASTYNIPRSGVTPDPNLVQGYVAIQIKRQNYIKFTPQINSNGATEFVVTEPLIPWPAPGNTSGLALVVDPVDFPLSIMAQIYEPGLCPEF